MLHQYEAARKIDHVSIKVSVARPNLTEVSSGNEDAND
jgi:hypothetical protein